MTTELRSGLIGASLALLIFSPNAFSNEIVSVSSLTGLRTAIDDAPSNGRTIQLDKGSYRQTSPISIQGKHNITVRGATSDYADTVISGPGINNPNLGINFKINNSDNITLQNLTIRDSFYHAVQINNNSDHFTADHLRALDNGEAGFKVTSPANASGAASYSDDGTIKNSSIGFTRAGQRRVVEGVDIVGAKGWNIRNNTFNNIKKTNGGAAYAAFAKGNSQDIIFENNTVKNSFIGISLGGGGTGPVYFRDGDTTYETRNGIIRNNLIYNLSDAGIYLNKALNFKVLGNTVINNGKGTGAVEARYPQSSGLIQGNKLSGPIKLRNGGTATTLDNTFVSANTPIPDDGAGSGQIAVDAPPAPATLSLFAMSIAGLVFVRRRKRRHEK